MLIVTFHNQGMDINLPPDEQFCDYNVEVMVTTSPTSVKTIYKGKVKKHYRKDGWKKLLELATKQL